MKKTVSVLLVLTILMVCIVGSSVADDFTIHSGVTFGMTMDEVKKAEKANGFSGVSRKLKYMSYSKDGTYKEKTTSGLVIEGTIASIPDSQIWYYFDDSEKLFEALYVFKGGNFSDNHQVNTDIQNQYDSVDEIIKQKYSSVGTVCTWEDYPNSIEAVDEHNLHMFSDVDPHVEVSKRNALKIKINDKWLYITHWLSQLSDYSTKNELILLWSSGHHYLDYRLITDEEIDTHEKIVKEKEEQEKIEQEEAEKEKQQQLNNDL